MPGKMWVPPKATGWVAIEKCTPAHEGGVHHEILATATCSECQASVEGPGLLPEVKGM